MDIDFIFISLKFKPNTVGQAGALLSYILDVPVLNFGRGTKYPKVYVLCLSPSKKMPKQTNSMV
jgi:hypothetical protein